MANKFVTFLEDTGKKILSVFETGVKEANILEPAVDAALPAFGSVYNAAVGLITQAEALGVSAASKGNTNAAKLASVVTALTPLATTELAKAGISGVTSTHVSEAVNGLVKFLNAFPAASAAATAPVPTSASPAA